jgi:hypothetical protein
VRGVPRASLRAGGPPGQGPEMISRNGPPGSRRRGSVALVLLLLAASERLYGALLMLYPEAFRHRYEAEMRRDFHELMLEGLEEGGAKELVRVWAQVHSDLVLTALKERGTLLARRYAAYSSVDPRIAKRAAARALFVVVLVTFGVLCVSLLQVPTYEASAKVRTSGAIEERAVAQETIERIMGLGNLFRVQPSPAEVQENLTIERSEDTGTYLLTYEDNDPAKAQAVVNTAGKVSGELVKPAPLYTEPVDPDPLRDTLLTLVIGLVLCAGVVVALPGVAASVAGKLGKPVVLQGVGQVGILGEALDRRGKLTAVEAALETSLSVEEANRMLQALAAKGHLEVTVEHGRLYYALWDRDAPL